MHVIPSEDERERERERATAVYQRWVRLDQTENHMTMGTNMELDKTQFDSRNG